MINAKISAEKYSVKTCHILPNDTVRIIIPKKWDCEYVNILLYEENLCSFVLEDGEYHFDIVNCGEIFLKRVIKSEKRHYVYLPTRYDGQDVLILPA